MCASTDLWVDRGTPSLLHWTLTVEDGGGLTRQGSTTVWPTKASTVEGSVLSMLTSPRVKLRKEEQDTKTEGRKGRKGRKEGWRIRRKLEDWSEEENERVTLCSTVGTFISSHQSKHKDRPQPGFRSLSERKDREETQLWLTNGPCNMKSDQEKETKQYNLHPDYNSFSALRFKDKRQFSLHQNKPKVSSQRD